MFLLTNLYKYFKNVVFKSQFNLFYNFSNQTFDHSGLDLRGQPSGALRMQYTWHKLEIPLGVGRLVTSGARAVCCGGGGVGGGEIIKGARGETDRDLLRAQDAPQFPADLLPNLCTAPVVSVSRDCGDTVALRGLLKIRSDGRRRKWRICGVRSAYECVRSLFWAIYFHKSRVVKMWRFWGDIFKLG